MFQVIMSPARLLWHAFFKVWMTLDRESIIGYVHRLGRRSRRYEKASQSMAMSRRVRESGLSKSLHWINVFCA